MATAPTYTVDEARRLLPTIRGVLIQIAVVRRADGDADALHALLDHLSSLGVIVRDIDSGLVDIPTIRDGEPAWLCWRLDDRELGWWHTTRDGYASRRRL